MLPSEKQCSLLILAKPGLLQVLYVGYTLSLEVHTRHVYNICRYHQISILRTSSVCQDCLSAGRKAFGNPDWQQTEREINLIRKLSLLCRWARALKLATRAEVAADVTQVEDRVGAGDEIEIRGGKGEEMSVGSNYREVGSSKISDGEIVASLVTSGRKDPLSSLKKQE